MKQRQLIIIKQSSLELNFVQHWDITSKSTELHLAKQHSRPAREGSLRLSRQLKVSSSLR